MWLINTKTLELQYFVGETLLATEYAILSHWWSEEEVNFQEMQSLKSNSEHRSKLGFRKIQHTIKQALEDGLQWAWVRPLAPLEVVLKCADQL
jgi:hypothetical protein